jgi:hypothetical protein
MYAKGDILKKLISKNKNMTDEMEDTTPVVSTDEKACGCEGDSCSHTKGTSSLMETLTKEHDLVETFTKQRDFGKVGEVLTASHNVEEIALAFLLALTPLAVLTFFGQVGLI